MVNSLLIDGLCHPEAKGSEEVWKPIPEYEGLYEASSLGRIRSAPNKVTSNARYATRVWKTRVLKEKAPLHAKRNDLRVTLWKNGKAKDFLVARLVASAWHGLPKERMTVNHINGNYLDNRPINLEWMTLEENIQQGFKDGLFSSLQKRVAIYSSNGTRTEFRSMSQCDNYLGRSTGYTSGRIAKGFSVLRAFDGELFQVEMIGA